jgi:hypothetical protein
MQAEIDRYMGYVRKEPEAMSMSKQAVGQARTHFRETAFIELNEHLLGCFYGDGEITTYKGYRLLCVDGSMLQLPHSQQLMEQYGNLNKSSYPLARMSVLYDVLNHMILKADMQPCVVSEKALADQQLAHLCSQGSQYQDIILFDRQYASLLLMLYLKQHNKQFLMRLAADSIAQLKEVTEALQQGQTDTIIEIDLQKQEQHRSRQLKQYRKQHPELAASIPSKLAIRIVIHTLPTSEREVLLTSLLDQEHFSYEDLAALYHQRWGVETRYHQLKDVLQLENFSGLSPLIIAQDFHASILTANLQAVALYDVQAELQQFNAAKERKYEYAINGNFAFLQLRNRIIALLLGQDDIDEILTTMYQHILRQKVPIRPGRSLPRKKRYKNKKFAFNQKRPFA